MPDWKSQLKRVLPAFLVRRLQESTKFHFSNGWPNLPLISGYYIRNCLLAASDFASYQASRKAIRNYRRSLMELDQAGGGTNHRNLHIIYGLKQREALHHFHWLLIEQMLRTTGADKVYFHYTYEPLGEYWERLKPR